MNKIRTIPWSHFLKLCIYNFRQPLHYIHKRSDIDLSKIWVSNCCCTSVVVTDFFPIALSSHQVESPKTTSTCVENKDTSYTDQCQVIHTPVAVMPLDLWHSLQWRHNGRYSVSNHQPHDCLFSRLFRRRSKKTPKLRVTGLCAGNSPETGEFPAQMASITENIFIWWRHHVVYIVLGLVWMQNHHR